MKITDHVWQVGGGSLTSPDDAAIYLIAFDTAAALIDAGCGWEHEKLVENIKQYLLPETRIKYLFITHCHFDHVGGAAAIKRQYGCTVVAHALDAPYLESGDEIVTAAQWYGALLSPLPIDHKINAAEETFTLGNGSLRAIHCPGHSPGSIVLVSEVNGKKILFGQDIHGPLHEDLLSNQADYKKSLNFLLSLEADILCEGHFGVYRGKQEVREFIKSFLR